MKVSALRIFIRAFVLTLGAHTAALADQTSDAPSLFRELVAQCPAMVDKLVGDQEFKPTLSQRPIDNAAVCACTASKLQSHPVMKELFQMPQATFSEKLKSERFASYVFVGLLSSVIGCLSIELDQTLQQAKPE